MILRYVAAFRREVTFWFQMSTLGRKIDAKSSRFLPRQLLLVTGADLVWGLVFVAPFLIRQDVSLELRGYAGYPAFENELVLQDVTRQVENVLYIKYIDINLIHVVILSEFCPMWMAWPWWSDHRLGDRGSRKCTVPDCLTFSAWQISTLSSRKRGETWWPTSRPYLSRLFSLRTCIRLMWVWTWIEQVRDSNTSSKRPEIPSTVHWKVLNLTRLQRWQQTTAVHQFAEAGWANSSVLFSISANFSISARDVLKICVKKWRCVFHAPQRPSRWELGPCQQVCRCSLTTISQSHHAPVWSDGLLAQQRSLLRDGDGKHFPQRCSARFCTGHMRIWSKSFHIFPHRSASFTFIRSVTAHLVGRLPNGCIFESTEGKGGSPMEMQLQKGAVIPGMDLALQEISWDLRSLVLIFFDLHTNSMWLPLHWGSTWQWEAGKATGFQRCGNIGTWIESAGKREGELVWPKNRSWLDDHFKIQELTLGSIAEIRIPSELAYGKKGIPRFLAPSISSFALVIVKDCFGLISQYITKDDLEISSEFRYRACRLWIDLWSSHLGSGWHSMRQRALREIGTCGIFCQRRRCLSSMVVGPSGVTRVDVWDFQLCFHVFMMFHVFWWSTDLSLEVFETWFPKGPRLLVPFEPNISDEIKLLQLTFDLSNSGQGC